MASTKRYFGLSWIVCVILAILPTNPFCGLITRIQRGHVLAGIICFILCPIFYFVDLVTMIISKDITILA